MRKAKKPVTRSRSLEQGLDPRSPLGMLVDNPCPVHGHEPCGHIPDPTAVVHNGRIAAAIEVACAYKLNAVLGKS